MTDRERLAEVEGRIQHWFTSDSLIDQSRAEHNDPCLGCDAEWLIAELRKAWEANASLAASHRTAVDFIPAQVWDEYCAAAKDARARAVADSGLSPGER